MKTGLTACFQIFFHKHGSQRLGEILFLIHLFIECIDYLFSFNSSFIFKLHAHSIFHWVESVKRMYRLMKPGNFFYVLNRLGPDAGTGALKALCQLSSDI